MHMSASTVGRHQILTVSNTWSCDMNDMNVASLAAGSLDGDTKTNFDDQQKIGETFPHL